MADWDRDGNTGVVWALVGAITATLGIGFALMVPIPAEWRELSFWLGQQGAIALAVPLGSLLTIVLGVWAALLLNRRTVAQEQSVAIDQRGRMDERFKAGAEMLGNSHPMTRIGGVVVLRELAVHHRAEFARQVVDVLVTLCEYLSRDWRETSSKEGTSDDVGKRALTETTTQSLAYINDLCNDAELPRPPGADFRFVIKKSRFSDITISNGSLNVSAFENCLFERTTIEESELIETHFLRTGFERCLFSRCALISSRINAETGDVQFDILDVVFNDCALIRTEVSANDGAIDLFNCDVSGSQLYGCRSLDWCYFIDEVPTIGVVDEPQQLRDMSGFPDYPTGIETVDIEAYLSAPIVIFDNQNPNGRNLPKARLPSKAK